MPNRKSLVLVFVLILTLAVPVLAQDEQPSDAEEGGSTFIVVGIDIFQRASEELDNGDYELAVQDFTLFILLNPTWGQGYYWRGRAYLGLEDYDSALTDFNQALALPSASPDATGQILNDRALVYIQQENYDAALIDLNAAIEAAPELPEPYYYRAGLHMENEAYEAAAADYDKVIELVPQFAGGYAGRGVANTQLGNSDQALADFDQAIELDSSNPVTYYQRSLLKAEQEDFTGALADLEDAIRLEPRQALFYLHRAFVHNQLGNTEAAAADYFLWIGAVQSRSVNLRQLNPGESQVLSLEEGVSYTLPFRAVAGELITLSATTRPDSEADPLIVLLDSNGDPAAADDDSGGETNALIEDYVVPADGVYTLVVSHSGGGTDGAVRILLQVE
jgi:tetratricopeptide (TPR) repeat protein